MTPTPNRNNRFTRNREATRNPSLSDRTAVFARMSLRVMRNEDRDDYGLDANRGKEFLSVPAASEHPSSFGC